jgi:MFS family permease
MMPVAVMVYARPPVAVTQPVAHNNFQHRRRLTSASFLSPEGICQLTATKSSTPRYYGWYIATTLAVTETISWGIIYYTFSVLIRPMERELGWSRTEMTGAFSLALLIAGGMAFPVGTWIDRHGARLLMTLGSIAASLLVLAWSQVRDLSMLYLIWAGLGICFAAVLYEPAFAVIAVWFVKRRTRALALVTFAAGLASTIFVPLSDALLNIFGWRDALVILGVFLALTTIPLHAIFLRRCPDDLGLLPDGGVKSVSEQPRPALSVSLRTTVRSKSFWMLTAVFGLANLTTAAIRVHFIPFLIASGINPSTAAIASGAIGLMQVMGRVIFPPLDTRWSSRTLTTCLIGLQVTAIVVLLLGVSSFTVVIFIAIFGAAYGAKTLARPSMIAEFYGSTHYARISSIMAIFLTLSNTLAPVGAGLIYDRYDTYQPVLWIVLFISFLAFSIMVLMKPDRLLDNVSASVLESADVVRM